MFMDRSSMISFSRIPGGGATALSFVHSPSGIGLTGSEIGDILRVKGREVKR
jgi:hypothetical protein